MVDKMSTSTLSLVLFNIALQALDVYLTSRILHKGGREYNPVLKWFSSKWAVAKVIITGVAIAVLACLGSVLGLSLVALTMLVVVLWNVRVLRRI